MFPHLAFFIVFFDCISYIFYFNNSMKSMVSEGCNKYFKKKFLKYFFLNSKRYIFDLSNKNK